MHEACDRRKAQRLKFGHRLIRQTPIELVERNGRDFLPENRIANALRTERCKAVQVLSDSLIMAVEDALIHEPVTDPVQRAFETGPHLERAGFMKRHLSASSMSVVLQTTLG